LPSVKRVVSISLGTSKRDKRQEVEILGEQFLIERLGTDGDMHKFAAMFADLDGKVAALGVGGADLWVTVDAKRYPFHQILKLTRGATKTPIVDGSGLKHTLERTTIEKLQNDGTVDFGKEKVLLVSAVDRFGMAQALIKVCPDIVFGDILFGLGMNVMLTSYDQVRKLGSLLLPIVTRVPFKWIYPTGKKQEERRPKYPAIWGERTFLCGDWHYIHRYAPDDLKGKTILTQTLRKADLDWLKDTGARRAITTTPVMGGETFATNVMEGVIVAILGKKPSELSENDYLETLKRLGWNPNVIDLNASAS
jgi:hypothetical protein